MINDFITANQAKDMANKRSTELKQIEDKLKPIMMDIRTEAQSGRYNICYRIVGKYAEEVRIILQRHGYHLSDDVDDDGDYISTKISWR